MKKGYVFILLLSLFWVPMPFEASFASTLMNNLFWYWKFGDNKKSQIMVEKFVKVITSDLGIQLFIKSVEYKTYMRK